MSMPRATPRPAPKLRPGFVRNPDVRPRSGQNPDKMRVAGVSGCARSLLWPDQRERHRATAAVAAEAAGAHLVPPAHLSGECHEAQEATGVVVGRDFAAGGADEAKV